MSEYRIAICDDVSLERDVLMYMLHEIDASIHTFGYASGEELLHAEETFDLIFLDIYMENMNGIETARSLREKGCTSKIIFLTSSSDFALESYEVYAYNYIVKPISRERLRDIWMHICEQEGRGKHLILQNTAGVWEVSSDEIEFLESKGHYVYVNLQSGEEIRVYGKLDDYEKELADPRFIRCHKSALVNLSLVNSLEEDFMMQSGKRVPYRKQGLKKLREQYCEFLMNEKH